MAIAQWLELFEEYGVERYVMIGLAVIGILLVAAGYRLFHIAVSLLGFLVSGGVFGGFMYFMFEPPIKMLILIFVLGGILGAYFANYAYKPGVFILSGIMGGFILYWLLQDAILTVAGGLLIAIIAVLLEKVILILLTSVAGSFLVVNLIQTYAKLPRRSVIIGAGILSLCGIIIQFLTTRKKKSVTEEEVIEAEPDEAEEEAIEAEPGETEEEAIKAESDEAKEEAVKAEPDETEEEAIKAESDEAKEEVVKAEPDEVEEEAVKAESDETEQPPEAPVVAEKTAETQDMGEGKLPAEEK